MYETLPSMLRRLAIVLAISTTGGLALYLLLSWVVTMPGAQYLICLVLGMPVLALIVLTVTEALQTGELPRRFGVDTRARNPVAYWVGLAVFVGSGLGLTALMLWCVAQLLGD
jgi:hypothetical protein